MLFLLSLRKFWDGLISRRKGRDPYAMSLVDDVVQGRKTREDLGTWLKSRETLYVEAVSGVLAAIDEHLKKNPRFNLKCLEILKSCLTGDQRWLFYKGIDCNPFTIRALEELQYHGNDEAERAAAEDILNLFHSRHTRTRIPHRRSTGEYPDEKDVGHGISLQQSPPEDSEDLEITRAEKESLEFYKASQRRRDEDEERDLLEAIALSLTVKKDV